MKKQTIIDSFKGIAIGDAFGVGIEFKSRLWMPDNVHFDTYVNVWKGGQNNITPGTYSDDTEHSIGVIRALLSNEPFSTDLLLRMFKNEYESDKMFKGFPRDGHGSIEDWYKGIKTIDEVRAAQASREDPGNAPVMRALPLWYIEKEQVENYACINADATHPNEMGRKASLLTVLTAWHFLREDGDRSDLISFLQAYIGMIDVKEMLDKIDTLPPPDQLTEHNYLFLHGPQPLPYIKWDTNIYGLPCAAMKTALNVVYVLKHSTNAFEALQHAINMGGDVDSLAAVCTGIAGGKYGLDNLPAFMLEQTEGLTRLERLGEEVYKKFFS